MNNSSIKRILVALDASEANRSALQAAATLASQLQAELQALFVEDINLLRLAELPFAREMMFGSSEGHRITPANMERQIQAQAIRLRRLVEATAQQSKIKAEFKVLRGQISRELLLASQQMDLLILGKSTQLLQQSLKLGKVAQDVLAAVNCNVLLMQYGASIERPVAVLFDGSQASERALQLAIQLAHNDHDQLKVIYPAVDHQQQQTLQQQVETITRPLGIDAGHILLHSNTSEALLQITRQYNSRILIVESDPGILNKEAIKTVVQQSPIPVIVMR
jgi:nucleotide-binding universal stress UspA family protein